ASSGPAGHPALGGPASSGPAGHPALGDPATGSRASGGPADGSPDGSDDGLPGTTVDGWEDLDLDV
ncbi:MAG: hypothetical protein ACRDJU_05740, partial [Actinomycetota bacterium]